jgi:hypothetical protein
LALSRRICCVTDQENAAMVVMLRLLKALSHAIVEAKLRRVERELMLRGIPFRPLPRLPND